MKAIIEIEGKQFKVDLNKGHDLSIGIDQGDQGVNAYYLKDAQFKVVRAGDFVGSVDEGGACDCFDVEFNPHGNGTHTECIGHAIGGNRSVNKALKEYFFHSQVLSVEPIEDEQGDLIVRKSQLSEREINTEALIIRTFPNNKEKLQRRYSGTNPPYFEESALAYLGEIGIKHLLVDLPSVDKESDGGKLLAHKAFWGVSDELREHSTITELIYIDNSIPDGWYLLNLQMAAFELDASPSRPVIYALEE